MLSREELKKKWIAALRSGEYTKIEEIYFDLIDNKECFCTIGLAGKILNPENPLYGVDKLFSIFSELSPTRPPADGSLGLWKEIINKNDIRVGDSVSSFEEMANFLEERLIP